MVEITFSNPSYLWTWLLLPFILIAHFYTLKKVKTAALKFSNFEAIERVSKKGFLSKHYKGMFSNKNIFMILLRLIIYTLLIFSVTGTTLWYTGKASDFNYVLALDTSTSMLADDFTGTRLGAAREAALVFVDSVQGQSDIGMVSFASSAFVDIEPSPDKNNIKEAIELLDIKESGGTNIGDAIITSVNLLNDEKAKVIVLLTDGQSNVGTPIDTAIDYAREKGSIVHTIGIGTEAGGKIFGLDITSKLDEESLIRISEATEGTYFRAESEESLQDSFREIASFTEERISLDISLILLITGLILLAIEWILMHSFFRKVP